MLNTIRINVLTLLTIVLSGFSLLGCDNQKTDGSGAVQQNQKNMPIEMIPADLVDVKTGTLAQYTPFTGTIQALHQTTIQSQVTATVLSVKTDVGQKVNRGQILAELNNQDNIARLAQAKANLASAQAQARLNRSVVERKQRLFNQGFISRLEWEQSQVEDQTQQQNVRAQYASVEIAQKAAQDAVIRSPLSGYLNKRQIDVGQTVNAGQTLFEIVDPDQLEIKANLSASDQSKLIIGQNLSFQIQGNPQVFQAQISRISPVADVNNRNIEFFAQPNAARQKLPIGAFVEGQIIQSGQASGQLIPLSSIHALQHTPFVWAVRHHQLEKIQIQIRNTDKKQNLALVSGLAEQDRISLVTFTDQDQHRPVQIQY